MLISLKAYEKRWFSTLFIIIRVEFPREWFWVVPFCIKICLYSTRDQHSFAIHRQTNKLCKRREIYIVYVLKYDAEYQPDADSFNSFKMFRLVVSSGIFHRYNSLWRENACRKLMCLVNKLLRSFIFHIILVFGSIQLLLVCEQKTRRWHSVRLAMCKRKKNVL